MSVTLAPRTEAMIRQKIDDGPYRDADELIQDALLALDERDRLSRLRSAIAIADAQLARGEGVPYSSELMDEIEREAEAALQRGELPRSDVVP
jgi:putative addiction module CopG family antidote